MYIDIRENPHLDLKYHSAAEPLLINERCPGRRTTRFDQGSRIARSRLT
jgi:hypothetical protein